MLWIMMKTNSFVFRYLDGFLSRITFYLSAGMAWVMVSFFDGKYMREIYTEIQALSIMGPFFWHWYAFGIYLTGILDNGDFMDFVFLGVWGAITVLEQVFQLILLPKVFEWAEEASILANDVEDDDD